jgi:hypothetical protein
VAVAVLDIEASLSRAFSRFMESMDSRRGFFVIQFPY